MKSGHMKNNKSFMLIIGLVILGIASRFLFLIDGFPSIPNFTALGAVALFGAYYLKKTQSIIIPLVILWLSDLILNNVVYSQYFDTFSFFGDPWVVAGFVATIVMGWYMIKKLSFRSFIGASILGAFVFFLITNFAVWIGSGLYPKNIDGLISCYIKAIPFFRNALLGNLFFGAILFGSYSFFTTTIPSLKLEKS